ncbi:cytochrome P450 [Bradyrhizobium sp. i1.8.4]|uniref:cytochrome P450 n=1 Tax=unclassified Bradyrhizobium TaxID=2631580 RepID=UPI003D1F2711
MSRLPFFLKQAPAHTRVRRVLAGHFTVRQATEHRPEIERIVANCLDDMGRLARPVDLVETFARAVPSLMSCEMFGIPESDRDLFERFTVRVTKKDTVIEDIVKANDEFYAFLDRLIALKQAQPSDDVFSELVNNGKLTVEELAPTFSTLLQAAHSAIGRVIAFSVFQLLKDRSRWNALVTKSVPIGLIVEEMLRYTIAAVLAMRMPLEDVELGGGVIKSFEAVAVSLSASNRDPQVFDNPDQLDLSRQDATRHLTFSYGIHQCLGQHFARLELEVALSRLAERFPTLDFAVPVQDIPWHTDRDVYAPQSLPVTW